MKNPCAERFTDLVILLNNKWIFTTNQYTESWFDGKFTGPQRPQRTTSFSFTLNNGQRDIWSIEKVLQKRDKFHKLFNVENETDVKGGVFVKCSFLIFAVEPLNLRIGAGLVKCFPDANWWPLL